MKKKGETYISDDFQLTSATLAWVQRKYPMVNLEETLDRFRRKAEAEGWMYRNWQRAFEGIVEKAMDNGWRSIVTLRGGIEYDPRWQSILHEARKFGFRDPEKQETPVSYKSQFDLWKSAPKPKNVLDLRGILKRVG